MRNWLRQNEFHGCDYTTPLTEIVNRKIFRNAASRSLKIAATARGQ